MFRDAAGEPAITIELSNLDKVLYPETGTTKGEVIAYYTAIAPAMLPHVAGRPVTRKRWPNGVGEASFFEKNLAEHAPDWLPRRAMRHSDRTVTYPLIDSEAGLAWIGQQASLEVHVPQWRFDGDQMGPATRLVFDLDPGPDVGLAECAIVALEVRDMVAEIGLRAFPVTSGSKGIHLYVPLDRVLSPGGASTVAKQVATNLEKIHPDLVTATMAKKVRTGKVFLDWSQNNSAKTTIAPYSMRGRTQPNVAAPRSWAEIEDRESLRHLRFDEVLARFQDDGDLLAGLDPPISQAGAARQDPLAVYRSMRDPARTPEPVPAHPPTPGPGNRYVIQEHHARRLHWDVRLERDGVLVSWAVPKGPPTDTKENRLAVHTEDHPLEYLDFHGSIPKGEYGAGTMTIWDSGTYEAEKWRDDEVIVVMRGERLHGRYALIRTGGKNWLMHLMREQPGDGHGAESSGKGRRAAADARTSESSGAASSDRPGERSGGAELPRGLSPMLATTGEVAGLDPKDWAFETKWDGYRLILEFEYGTPTLRSRAGNIVTDRYPQIAALAEDLAGHRVVLDGEAVVFDANGVANLALLQADTRRAELVAFDLLYLDGTSLIRKRYSDRRRVLEALAATTPALSVPPQLAGTGEDALNASRDVGAEGVVAKRRDSVYLPGKRGHSWVKQRNWQTQQVVVGGFRGSAARPFASLLVGTPDDGKLIYVGRVGTGFSEDEIRALATKLQRRRRKTSPFVNEMSREETKDATWVTPEISGTVRFMNWTDGGRLWHPAWLGRSD
ncbi:ATP-dependent DNA ligase [Nocardia cyriacigeorgica]|uniref:ATP-dependent DNA ligase n=1 Tax=Nocardia cyriacigeorgica TaxID=135487 RepID=UPI0018936533|nr:ATP-dependent DNA ligase [Nocardia cyriacigeorgica]MBF6456397.1 ATP-dependent DNA ligase [Nocardia cyriacigeorgica]MBF6480553.1 ATP-dependent DNA ligase [Nocardia cyriacigeorgica]MBF6551203.1 ATP-dependent DNA ligase [Nocardia cyriacigeorgica]